MIVKALNKVPILLGGDVVDTAPGQEYDIDDATAEALLRGGDAVKVAAPLFVEQEAVQEAPKDAPIKTYSTRRRRKKKDYGSAPENKDAGPAPENK